MSATLTLHGSKFASTKMAGVSVGRVRFSTTLFARWNALAGGCTRSRFYSTQSQESQAPEDELHVNYLDGEREGSSHYCFSLSLTLSLSLSLSHTEEKPTINKLIIIHAACYIHVSIPLAVNHRC